MNQLARPFPRPPANLAPWVEVLGADLAVNLFLTFGGCEVYLAPGSPGRGALANLVGKDRMQALATHAGLPVGKSRVPLANRWLAAALDWQGHPVAEIARRLRVTDATVRRYLAEGHDQARARPGHWNSPE